jgi:hypothetical protein
MGFDSCIFDLFKSKTLLKLNPSTVFCKIALFKFNECDIDLYLLFPK